MKRMTAVLLTAFFLSAAVPAIADDGDSHPGLQDPYLRNVEQYRWKASTLEGKRRELGYRQQWVVSELIDVCYELAETKLALAGAADRGDRNRQRLLEKRYFALKAEEGQLWDELERLNR